VHGIAKLLSHYDIKPRTVRFDGGETAKGYRREQFEEAFSRYLATSNRHTVTTRMDKGIAADSETSHVTDADSRKPAWIKGCDGVTDEIGNRRGEGDPELQAEVERILAKHADAEGHLRRD
jgi:hypothetical protein